MKTALLSILLFALPFTVSMAQGSLSGTISHDNHPLAGVTVSIPELEKGTFSDSEGFYRFKNIPVGTYDVRFTFIGFTTIEKEIDMENGADITLDISMKEAMSELDQLVVTGTMKETTIRDSPVKVQWISQNVLNKSASENIMDAVKYINGLYKQVDCAVCGTSNIRINGMEGPYTSVLIDGMPVMGALASVYSLNGINPTIIRNLEIIKGPNSTLYGSQAMGGVVNIITADPVTAPLLSVHSNTNSHGEQNFNISAAPQIGKTHTLLSGSVYHAGTFIDENNDGFGDLTQDTRVSLFNKWEFNRPDFKEFKLAAKLYYENRLGGVENYSHDLRGSSEIYGESIYTRRFDIFGHYDLPFRSIDLSLDASYSYHDQDSWYGDYHYVADQQTLFTNLIWDEPLTEKNDFLAGLTFRHDRLTQLFDGMELTGGSVDRRFVPGIFAQYDHIFNDQFRSLIGFRADHHQNHGIIYSPRINMKYSPNDHRSYRLNVGTGFRIVNLFTEEHEALTGSRQVIVAESLNPERSLNLAFNANQIIDIGPSVLNADLDIFYTRFTNQIIPDYSDVNSINYTNLDGYSVSRGISLSIAHNFIIPLTYMAGITVQDVFQLDNNQREDILFSPDYTAVFNLTYTLESARLTFDYTGRVNGPMQLPEYEGRSSTSNVFTEQNLKVTKILSNRMSVYISGKNLFNYTQNSPLIAPDRPFSDEFATDYVYGPIQGRRFMAGFQLELD